MDDEVADSTPPAERALDRVLALSDGVFAIALTLLVLNLDLPDDTSTDELGEALRDELPQLWTYALSFAVIGMFWLAHHRLYEIVVRTDLTLLILNLCQLGLIAMLPFPTEVLGDYPDESAAVVLYAAVLGLTALVSSATSLHVARHGLARAGVPRERMVHGVMRGLTLGAVFLASIPLALVSPSAAELSWALVAVIHVVLGRRFGSIYRQPAMP